MNNLANLLPCCGDKDVSKYKEAIVDPLLKKAPEKTQSIVKQVPERLTQSRKNAILNQHVNRPLTGSHILNVQPYFPVQHIQHHTLIPVRTNLHFVSSHVVPFRQSQTKPAQVPQGHLLIEDLNIKRPFSVHGKNITRISAISVPKVNFTYQGMKISNSGAKLVQENPEARKNFYTPIKPLQSPTLNATKSIESTNYKPSQEARNGSQQLFEQTKKQDQQKKIQQKVQVKEENNQKEQPKQQKNTQKNEPKEQQQEPKIQQQKKA